LNLGKNTDYPHLRFFVPVICQHNNFRSWLWLCPYHPSCFIINDHSVIWFGAK
jgi:hypothetical protein